MTSSQTAFPLIGILLFLLTESSVLPLDSLSAFGEEFSNTGSATAVENQAKNPPGYGKRIPTPEDEVAFPSQFKTPPPGYGEVPFWWWTGERLDKERLLWEVEELHKAGIAGVQVNYAHQDTEGWPTYPNDPEIFTDSWWDAYSAVAAACYEKGMGIGLSGYTLDWQESPMNLFARILYHDRETLSRNFLVEKKVTVKKGERLAETLPADADSMKETVAVIAYPLDSDGIPRYDAGEPIPGATSKEGGKIDFTPTGDTEVWFYVAVSVPNTLNPLHPESGQRVIDRFFRPFEEHSPSKSSKGLNYFFQDELQIGTGSLLWSDDLAEEFFRRKGYSLFEALPVFYGGGIPMVRKKWAKEATNHPIGEPELGATTPDGLESDAVAEALVNACWDRAVKYRLDFFDVRVRLAEERYFRPIYDWHRLRGMIYACDPGSRGYDPFEFGDYFSAVRWYSAPGHDTPGGQPDFIKNKVSASIAHFYQRPRVWLEGYHSLGWGATPERIFQATCENFVYGANLLNLHGLYYSTYGGWWEWAPPCYHFRMPYWRHYGRLLRYFERLSFLMSQGIQRADILIYYPVSAWQSETGGREATDCAFEAAKRLRDAGMNFFFVDDDSIARGVIKGGRLVIDGQEYRTVILPKIKGIRWSTLDKLREFQAEAKRFSPEQPVDKTKDAALTENRPCAGGVIALGNVPAASDRAGSRDPKLTAAVTAMFGPKENPGNDVVPETGDDQFWAKFLFRMEKSHPREVYVEGNSQKRILFQRRTFGNREIFLIMGADPGERLVFNAVGKVEFWDPWTGQVREALNVQRCANATSTTVTMPPKNESARVILFSSNEKPLLHSMTTDLVEITGVFPPTTTNPNWTAKGRADHSGLKSMTVVTNGVGGEPGRVIRLTGEASRPETEKTLDGSWESELIPTLDNRFGDFRLPVEERFLGPEARRFDYREVTAFDPTALDSGWEEATRVTYGFGPKFWKLGPIPKESATEEFAESLTQTASFDETRPVHFDGKESHWTPYAFSWREGIEGNPGHEGYHGLKENLDDRFIGLGAVTDGLNEKVFVPEGEGVYYLRSTVSVKKGDPGDGSVAVRILTEGNPPDEIWLDGEKIDPSTDHLVQTAEKRPLLIRFGQSGRSAVVFAAESAEQNRYLSDPKGVKRTPLSMKWFDLPGRLEFDVHGDSPSGATETADATPAQRPTPLYRFVAPPGLISAVITARSPVRVFAAGREFTPIPFSDETFAATGLDGGKRYRIDFGDSLKTAVPIVLAASPHDGDWGGSLFPEPIRLHCEPGVMELGDWNRQGTLETYSGSVCYRKTFHLTADEAKSADVSLDLGSVCASARVTVNGHEAGTLVTSPWRIEIAPWIHEGENRLEIEVCNTLSNHYLTIPTRYRGDSPSGLLGPVRLQFRHEVTLQEDHGDRKE